MSTPIYKKAKTLKGPDLLGKASDQAFDEAVEVFKTRLENKKVPVKLCQDILAHFYDAKPKDIPKQKAKVYKELALQSYYETDSDNS